MRLSASFILLGGLILCVPEPTGSATPPPGGEIRGRVEIQSTLTTVSRQWGIRYRSRGRSDQQHHARKQSPPEVTNVVVYLEEIGTARSYGPPRQPMKLVQRNGEFIPHVLPVLKGTRVEIVNNDDYYHNVFSNSSVKKFNIGQQLTDAVVAKTFDEVGFIPVFCDIHLDMSAYIVVLPNPYFATPDESGSFTIANVPPGRYRVLAWHERLVTQSQEVVVPESGGVTVDFTL